MTERTLEQAEKVIEQLEIKNLELQVESLQAQIAGMLQMKAHIEVMGPILDQRLQYTLMELDKRQPKPIAKS